MALHRRESQSARRLETLVQVTAELNELLPTPDRFQQTILARLAEVVDLSSACVQIAERAGLKVVALYGLNHADHVIGNLVFPLDDSFPNVVVLKTRRAMALDDVRERFPHFQDEAQEYGSAAIRSWLGVPLMVGERALGVITVDRHSISPFTDDEIELVTAFAHHVAVAIWNSRLYQDLVEADRIKADLIKEIHHRVKNDMNLIVGLLRLSADRLPDPRAQQIFSDMEFRLISLSRIHERLYLSDETGWTRLHEYVDEVVREVRAGYVPTDVSIEIRVDADEVEASSSVAIPFGLALAELILNAFKHAFPQRSDGIITVELRRTDGEDPPGATLTVRDNGVGMDRSDDDDGFGLSLVEAMVGRLSGTFSRENSAEGTAWRIEVPVAEPGAAPGTPPQQP